MESFLKKFSDKDDQDVKRISTEQMKELKDKGISTEIFLDYLCQKHGYLLHGSIHEIPGNKLKSSQGKLFASNKSAIAIMKSLYSNINVNLSYPYFFDKDNPLVLKIHTPPNGKFISKENGFIYIINNSGFQNEPEGSWQFIKNNDEQEFTIILETEKDDFNYPVEVYEDLRTDKNKK